MDALITVVCEGPCRGVFAEADLGVGADKVRMCPGCRMKRGMDGPRTPELLEIERPRAERDRYHRAHDELAVRVLTAENELARLRAEARRWYLDDGIFIELDAAQVTKRRKAAARDLAALQLDRSRLQGELLTAEAMLLGAKNGFGAYKDVVQHVARQHGWDGVYHEVNYLAAVLSKAQLDASRPIYDLGVLTSRVGTWVAGTFGTAAVGDRWERAARVVEEAIELAQAEGLPAADVAKIALRVYSRAPGEVAQEAGGLMVCLLAWAAGRLADLTYLTVQEIERIEQPETVKRIRAKQAEKAAAGVGRGYGGAIEPSNG